MGATSGCRLGQFFNRMVEDQNSISRFQFAAVGTGLLIILLSLIALQIYQHNNLRTVTKIQNAFTEQYQDLIKSRLTDLETKAEGVQTLLQTLNRENSYAKGFHIQVNSAHIWSDLPKFIEHQRELFSSKQSLLEINHNPATGHPAEFSSGYPWTAKPVLLVGYDATGRSPPLELTLPLLEKQSAVAAEFEKAANLLGMIHLELNLQDLQQTLDLLEDTTKFSASLRFTDINQQNILLHSKSFLVDYNTTFSPSLPEVLRHMDAFGGHIDLQLKPTEHALQIAGFGTYAVIAKVLSCFALGFLTWLVLTYVFHRFFIHQRLRLLAKLEKVNLDLRDQTRKLDASQRNSEDFIGILGHEIRNPLSSLKYIQTELAAIDLPDHARRLIAIQEFALTTALDTLNNTLDLKKMELSALELETIEFEPLLIMEEIRGLISVQCRNKRIVLNIHLDRTMPSRIKGDPLRFKQVLLNLLNNAVKFTRTGGSVELIVTTESINPKYVTVRFQVIDTGDGIEPHMIEKLLERYQQADSSIARQYGGTGLGLNIASRIIHLMGGSLNIESKPGKGSHFTFNLRFEYCEPSSLAVELLIDPDKDRRLSALQHQFDPATKKLTLLYVDDDEFNLMIANELTRKSGHQLFSFTNPRDAIEFLNQSSMGVDIALSDLHMPDVAGSQFAHEVRQTKAGTSLFLAAMTASHEEELKAINTSNFDFVFRKPFNLEKIIDHFEKFKTSTDKEGPTNTGSMDSQLIAQGD